MRTMWCVLVLAGCDPIWSAHVTVRDPSNQPIAEARVELDCSKSERFKKLERDKVSDAQGEARMGGMGTIFPTDCDIVIAKPGYRPFTIVYRERCPKGPDSCRRVFDQTVTLQPEK